MVLLKATYSLVFFLDEPITVCLLIGEFSSFTLKSDYQYMRMYNSHLSFVFWLLCISIVSFPYVFVCSFSLVGFFMILHVSRFLSCGLCKKKMFHTYNSFFLSNCILSSFTCASLILLLHPLYVCIVTNYHILCCTFLNYRGYSLFKIIFPCKFYVIIKFLVTYSEIGWQFPASLCLSSYLKFGILLSFCFM